MFKPTKFMLPTSHYDEIRAEHAIVFIESLRHTKGEWDNKPFKLLEWQKDIVRNIFGVIKSDGSRQFTTAYVEIAKKQGKTELGAAIALYMLVADEESGAEIYSCAADRAQAGLVYKVAVDMIARCPALQKRLKVLESQKRVIFAEKNSFYQVLSSEAYSKHGINPHAVLYDELHVANREMARVMLQGASDARRQPLNFLITTAGNDMHSIGFEIHQKALDILDGRKTDSTFYPTIFAADEKDDWSLPSTWRKANPSLGVTVQEDRMRMAFESARQTPTEENSFRQLRLCQWVKQSVRWMPMEKWDKCNFAFNPEELVGRECFGGLDMSTTTDLTAFVLIFPPIYEGDRYKILPFFWLPEDSLEIRVKRDHVPYDLWKSQGFLQTTEGNVVHYGFVESFILDLADKYSIKEIAFDPWNATQISQRLGDEGLTMVQFRQGMRSLSPPTKELMRLTLSEEFAHAGHPVLRWCMDNVHVFSDNNENIRPDKKISTERIDGAVATIMALSRAVCQYENTTSIYDERGLLIL